MDIIDEFLLEAQWAALDMEIHRGTGKSNITIKNFDDSLMFSMQYMQWPHPFLSLQPTPYKIRHPHESQTPYQCRFPSPSKPSLCIYTQIQTNDINIYSQLPFLTTSSPTRRTLPKIKLPSIIPRLHGQTQPVIPCPRSFKKGDLD